MSADGEGLWRSQKGREQGGAALGAVGQAGEQRRRRGGGLTCGELRVSEKVGVWEAVSHRRSIYSI